MTINVNSNVNGAILARQAIQKAHVTGYNEEQITKLVKEGADEFLLRTANSALKGDNSQCKVIPKNKILARIDAKIKALKNDAVVSQQYSDLVAKNESKFTIKKAFTKAKNAIGNAFDATKEATKKAYTSTKTAVKNSSSSVWNFIKKHKVATAIVSTIIATAAAAIAIHKLIVSNSLCTQGIESEE